MSIMIILDSLQTTLAGILRGMNRSNIVAIGTFISYYAIM